MIVREIQAKTLLGTVPQPDSYFGLKYNFNLYRGCQHQCIYCDSRSSCYQIEDFGHEILVKANALELLEKELARKRVRGTIGTGSMNDPYMPLEADRNLTCGALQIIARHGFGVHIITKSDLVVRDIEVLQAIGRVYAAVTFTITCADDQLAKKLEPGAPASSARFRAIQSLSARGIYTGVSLMPLLPFIEDNEKNLAEIVERAAQAGARYIIPGFSVTLRDRQRDYYYDQLDHWFPGMRKRYEQTYGERYGCAPPNCQRLRKFFEDLCARVNLPIGMDTYQARQAWQPRLEL